MPIRQAVKKSQEAPPSCAERTGEYSANFTPPQAYKPVQTPAPKPAPYQVAGVPASSTRDLNYFFSLAGSLYRETVGNEQPDSSGAAPAAPPAYNDDFRDTHLDPSAVLVIWLFRQTLTYVNPVAERFHLGPADRQPLYSVTAQPSIRSAYEFNELAVQRRDPIKGTWYNVCTSDIEPSLDLVKPGNWRVAKLRMESIPVWQKILAGKVVTEVAHNGKGNTLQLSWGDRKTLGPLGEAYGLWWESGNEHGIAEAFYVVERWKGFDENIQGLVRVKPAIQGANRRYEDPHFTSKDLAVVYFHCDGITPPQFVCTDVNAQMRLDVIMAGLMTVMIIETRKRKVIKEFGALPSYGTTSHWSSPLVEEGLEGIYQ